MQRVRFLAIMSLICLTAPPANAQLSKLRNYNVDEQAMNLVPNPSFEEAEKFPCKWNQGLGNFDKWSTRWTSPTETTPDILSKNASKDCWSNPRVHSDGKQLPHDGQTMIGIKVYGKGGSDTYWHEYVQVELTEPLIKDSLYHAHVWVNLSSRASKATNNIGIAFSDSVLHTQTRHPLYITPRVNSDKVIKQGILGWKKVAGVFKANGGETHLIIGNFYSDKDTEMERLDTGREGAYYYIDDVMLRKVLPGEKESKAPMPTTPPAPLVVVEERASTEEIEIELVAYEVGTTIELNSVFFEVGKAELKPESQKELDKLVGMMFDYPYMEIEVNGHTDSSGDMVKNQALSKARAQAVVAYLLHKDVHKERLAFNGFGSTIPLATNDTPEGRMRNRRVEFKVTKR